MHGNTYQHESGYKTRDFDDVMREVHGFFAACDDAGVWPGGVHVELTARTSPSASAARRRCSATSSSSGTRVSAIPGSMPASRLISRSRPPNCSAADSCGRSRHWHISFPTRDHGA